MQVCHYRWDSIFTVQYGIVQVWQYQWGCLFRHSTVQLRYGKVQDKFFRTHGIVPYSTNYSVQGTIWQQSKSLSLKLIRYQEAKPIFRLLDFGQTYPFQFLVFFSTSLILFSNIIRPLDFSRQSGRYPGDRKRGLPPVIFKSITIIWGVSQHPSSFFQTNATLQKNNKALQHYHRAKHSMVYLKGCDRFAAFVRPDPAVRNPDA